MEIHYGIQCNDCGMGPIKGRERFQCLICPDYDLCGHCKLKGYRVLPCNEGHEMERKLAPSEFLGVWYISHNFQNFDFVSIGSSEKISVSHQDSLLESLELNCNQTNESSGSTIGIISICTYIHYSHF